MHKQVIDLLNLALYDLLTNVTKKSMLEIADKIICLYKCTREMIKECKTMNGISNKSSNRANQTESVKPVKTVETAGSLAMNSAFDYFSVNVYDSFSSSNPFAVNYAQYSDSTEGAEIACGGFLSDFSNAVSTIGTASFTGGATASCASSSGGCSSGGFTSFC